MSWGMFRSWKGSLRSDGSFEDGDRGGRLVSPDVPSLETQLTVGMVAGPRPKPSLPNLKLNQPLSSIHPSTSSLSLRSDSTDATTTTSTSSPIDSLHSTPSRPILNPSSSHLNRPPRANSIPPEVMTPIPTRRRFARVVEKKASDPTPLRQSIGSNGQLIPTSSPEVMEEPLEEQDLLSVEARKRKDSTESGRVVSKGSLGSNGPGSYPGSLLPAATIHDPQPSSSAASSQSHLNVSSRSHIDVSLPTPRPFPNHPPARSGTLPSPATLIDHIPTKAALNHPRPDSSSRTSSTMSATNRVISSSSNTALSSLNPLRRHGSTSGPGPPILQPDGPVSSGHRKGTTPAQRLKLHTCTWDYDLQHAMRIPLGRTLPVPPALSISALPGRSKGPAPILGAGPLSDSGIRLIIEQLPTTAATSVQGGIGANKESAGSMVQTVHHANHEKGNPSELGKAPKGSTDGEKSIFGMVDVDLAAFAGKGRTTRRFLLKGSKTNATVKVSQRSLGWYSADGSS